MPAPGLSKVDLKAGWSIRPPITPLSYPMRRNVQHVSADTVPNSALPLRKVMARGRCVKLVDVEMLTLRNCGRGPQLYISDIRVFGVMYPWTLRMTFIVFASFPML